jgi:hypothetical protein
MTTRLAGPAGSATNSPQLDTGTLARTQNRAPGTLGHTRRRLAPVRVDTLLFDADQLIGFLESVAHARVVQMNTRLQWKDYDESTVLNIIYTVMKPLSYGKPGTVDVETGDIDKVRAQTQEQSQQLQEQFILAMRQGAGRVVHFLEAQEEVRRSALGFIDDAFREARNLNEAMRAETSRGLARLTLIKAASTITFKALALSVAGWPGFFMGAGYDITLSVVKEWDDAASAALVGLWSKSWKKVVKDTARNTANIYKGEASDAEKKAEWLSKRMAEREDELFEEGSKAARKYSKDGRKLLRAQQAAAAGRNAARVLGAVKYGFFAWDVYKTGLSARDELHQAGYDNAFDGVKDAFR